jgi:hypothetical protein
MTDLKTDVKVATISNKFMIPSGEGILVQNYNVNSSLLIRPTLQIGWQAEDQRKSRCWSPSPKAVA